MSDEEYKKSAQYTQDQNLRQAIEAAKQPSLADELENAVPDLSAYPMGGGMFGDYGEDFEDVDIADIVENGIAEPPETLHVTAVDNPLADLPRSFNTEGNEKDELRDIVRGDIAPTKTGTEPSMAGQKSLTEEQRRQAVIDYLWDHYSGKFKAKDELAAKRFGMTLKEYVIGGLNPRFADLLVAAGKKMEADGIKFEINAGFRDDFRQSIATGKKAAVGLSWHGGSVTTKGYGDGRAVDINGSAAQTWIDQHG
jgi:hypothetical protein